MDLSSQQRTTPAALSGIIKVGNAVKVINTNDLVTPAENAALYQTHANGNQSLLLGVNGNAIGGLLNITPQMASSLLDKVIIPAGVTAFSSADVLQVANSFTNSGNFYAITNNPSQVAATIAAQSIFNQSNAVLSTVLQPSMGIASANPRLGLVLDAVNELVNMGTISSAGNLTLTAGQSINNSATVTGAAVTINSPSITNSGSITADAGDVAISSATNNLWINNDGGIIRATAGSIDIAEPSSFGNSNVDLYGGTLSAQQINVVANSAKLSIDVQEIDGVLNVAAKSVNVRVNTGNLTVGSMVTLPPVANAAPASMSLFSLAGLEDLPDIQISTINSFQGGALKSGGVIKIFSGGSIQIASAEALGQITLDAQDYVLVGGDLESGSQISVLARNGSAAIAGISSSAQATGIPSVVDLRNGQILGYTVSVGAHGDIHVGDVISPDGSVIMRAGATIVGFSVLPGESPGSIQTGEIDVSSSDGTQGFIYLDARNGFLQTKSLSNNGGVIHLQAGDGVLIDGEIENDARTGRISIDIGQEVRPNWVQITSGGPVTIVSRDDIKNRGGDFVIQSAGFVDLNVDRVIVGDVFGNGSMFTVMAFGGVNLNQSQIVSGSTHDVENFVQILTSGDLQTSGAITISASGVSGGTGGVINIAAKTLTLGGPLRLLADSDSWYNGAVNIDTESPVTLGPGHILISASNNHNQGRGGVASVRASGGVTVNQGGIDISAGPDGDGGDIYLLAGPFSNSWFSTSQAGDLLLNTPVHADGNGTGTGGTITTWSRSVNLQGQQGVLLSATSGQNGGDGGAVTVISGTDLNIRSSVLTVAVLGSDGYGGSINLVAGDLNDGGNLLVNGSLDVSGKGYGGGGTIDLLASSAGSGGGGGPIGGFAAASTTSTGNISVTGSLIANAGTNGNGGSIHVQAIDRGDASPTVSVGTAQRKTSVHADGGTESGWGGNVEISSEGSAELNTTQVSAKARGEGSGGSINVSVTGVPSGDDGGGGGPIGTFAISAQSTFPSGQLLMSGTVLADAHGNGDGGLIKIHAPIIDVFGATAISADGRGIGNGGAVEIQSTDSRSDLSFSGGATRVSATGGTASGNGGNIKIEAGGNLNIDQNGADARVLGSEGNGGNVALTAGSEGTLSLNGGAIDVSGKGTGYGGNILLRGSNISAGNGETTTSLKAQGGSNGGSGGTVQFDADNEVFLHDIAVNVAGLKGDGGIASFDGGTLVAIGKLTVNADGGNSGGQIRFRTGSSDLELANDQLRLLARGGAGSGPAAEGSEAGTVLLESAADMRIGNEGGDNSIIVNGENGASAGVLNFNGQDDVEINAGISAQVLAETGKPGSISIQTPGNVRLVGDLNVSSHSSEGAGSIYVDPNDLIHLGNAFAKCPECHGGWIKYETATGRIEITGDAIASGAEGGSIYLEAGSNIKTGHLLANATTGTGGSVAVRSNMMGTGTAPLLIGPGEGDNHILSISAVGAVPSPDLSGDNFVIVQDHGNGGIHLAPGATLLAGSRTGDNASAIILESAAKIDIDANINNAARAPNANGGSVSIISPIVSFGPNTRIDASGNGVGSGGKITLLANEINFQEALYLNANGEHGGIELDSPNSQNLSIRSIEIDIPRVLRAFRVDFEFTPTGQTGPIAIHGSTGKLMAAAIGTVRGGEVNIKATDLSIETGALRIDASGHSSFAHGGDIGIDAKTLSLQTSRAELIANGTAAGGGNVTVQIISSDLAIGNASNQFHISVRGGTNDSGAGGQGGIVKLVSGTAGILIDGAGLSVSPGTNAKAGSISASAMQGTLSLKNVLNANGNGTGSGGSIELVAQNLLFENGTKVTVDGGETGASGHISIRHLGTN